MNCSADGPQPPAAATAPVVATTLKNDRRSIPLIHSSALLAMAGDAVQLDVLRRGALRMKTGGLTRESGLQPCEPYHVKKPGVNKLGAIWGHLLGTCLARCSRRRADCPAKRSRRRDERI